MAFEITSTPQGATIVIDGEKQLEKTPASLKLHAGKSHVIQIEMEGYYSATDSTEPAGGGYGARKLKTEFHFELRPLPSKVIKELTSSSLKINLSDTGNFFVGVIDVKLSSSLPKELQLTLTNSIISELVGFKKFRVVDRANRDAILKKQASQLAGCVEEKCSVEVGKLIGVNRMVIGSVSRIGSKYFITVKMVNVETGLVEGFSESTVGGDINKLTSHVKNATRALFK